MNTQGDIYAYELLYRDTQENMTAVDDNLHATARVLVNTLNYIGLKTLTRGHRAFIKVDEKMLMDGIINAISPAYFILEILESTIITSELIERIHFLHKKGYRFALNHYRFDNATILRYHELLILVDYVKIDLGQTDDPASIIPSLEAYDVKCIAEKVEDKNAFERARSYGFHFFQGYYFCRPDLFKKESFEPDSSLLLELIYLLKTEASLETLLHTFEKSAYLTVNLLRFISIHEDLSKDSVTSIEQALVLIGRDRLTNWLELMFYADGGNAANEANPRARQITYQALQRACLMEELARTVKRSSRFADTAYITGMLSVSEAMFENGCGELLKEVQIDQHISDALLHNKGELGRLLELVIAIEKNDTNKIGSIVLELDISEQELNRCLLESYRRSAAETL